MVNNINQRRMSWPYEDTVDALTHPFMTHEQFIPTKSYKINEFITLKLENNKTNIYINGELFRQCMYVLLNFTRDNIDDYNEILDMDEAIKKYNRENESNKMVITPETEFWGHCSNLEAWVENDYSLDVLHSSLSFPLLGKLSQLGDKKAQFYLKEEILKRIERGKEKILTYFLNEKYLDIFTSEELSVLFEMITIENQRTLKMINKLMNIKRIIEKYKETGHQHIILNKY